MKKILQIAGKSKVKRLKGVMSFCNWLEDKAVVFLSAYYLPPSM
ncbi:MAG: hypothetical protein AABY58_11220 [Nitrospirota bacterium]|jgi:hypothetical protein